MKLKNNMQTFLPYPDFRKSAQCLDNKRLGKQRVEILQILQTLLKKKKRIKKIGWKNHPAVLQWKSYEMTLIKYGFVVCDEWIKRGFKDTVRWKLLDISRNFKESAFRFPFSWWGNDKYHSSHRSNLLRKNFKFYSQYGWSESADIPYYWPVKGGV